MIASNNKLSGTTVKQAFKALTSRLFAALTSTGNDGGVQCGYVTVRYKAKNIFNRRG